MRRFVKGWPRLRRWQQRCLVGLAFVILMLATALALGHLSRFLKAIGQEMRPLSVSRFVQPVRLGYDLAVPCEMRMHRAVRGYTVVPVQEVEDPRSCLEECTKYKNCTYWSVHRIEREGDLMSLGEPSELRCHLLTALEKVSFSNEIGATSGTTLCSLHDSCITTDHKGLFRPGDLEIARIDTAAACQTACQETETSQCIAWSLNLDAMRQGTCVLHRGFSPSFDPEASRGQTITERWPFVQVRVSDGSAITGSRSCNLREIGQMIKYIENKYDLSFIERSDQESVGPSQTKRDLWFYSNTVRDGGPFPVDNRFSTADGDCAYGSLYNMTGANLQAEIVSSTQGEVVLEQETNTLRLVARKGHELESHYWSIPGLWLHDGLWATRIRHLPTGCGVSYRISLQSQVPTGARIEVLRGKGYESFSQISLKTYEQCDISMPLLYDSWHPSFRPISAATLSGRNLNCQEDECVFQTITKDPDTGELHPIAYTGAPHFNEAGRGTLLVSVDRATHVKVWLFTDRDTPIELNVGNPDPHQWALRPVDTQSGAIRYVPATAWFPLMRGCEAVRRGNCRNSNALECVQLIENCEEHVVQMTEAIRAQESEVTLFPVGCVGYQSLNSLSFHFEIEVCGENGVDWSSDPVCATLEELLPESIPAGLLDPEADELDKELQLKGTTREACLNRVSLQPEFLAEAIFRIEDIRMFGLGSGECASEGD